jgi:hypothetical protein
VNFELLGAVADCKRLPSRLGCSGGFLPLPPAPEPTRLNERQGRMNAVERLLAHGEQVVLLFDEMLDSRADPDPVQADCIVRRLQDWHPLYTPFADISLELSAAPPRYRSVLNEQRLRLMELWWSETALDAAARKAITAAATEELGSGKARDLSPFALNIYCRMLECREQLLSPARLQNLAADVVAESPLWGLLGERAAALSEQVVASLQILSSENPRVYKRSPPPGSRCNIHVEVVVRGAIHTRKEWLAQRAEAIMPALDSLRPYAKPPALPSTSEEKASLAKNKSGGRRPPAGGRPRKYSASLRQAIIADRKKEERKKNPKPLKTWLTSWATEHDMKRADALKMYNAEMAAIRRAQQARSR